LALTNKADTSRAAYLSAIMEAAIGIIGALAYLGIVYLVMDLWGGTH